MAPKSFFKKYFNFSRSERYGILGLCTAILLVIAIRAVLPHFIRNDAPDTTIYEKEIASFRQALDSVSSSVRVDVEPMDDIRLFRFDPNNTKDDEWKKLGLSDRQIRNIKNYLAKGGRFAKKEDLRKMYTLSEAQYKVLEPYILIANKKKSPEKIVERKSETNFVSADTGIVESSPKRMIQVELNAADSMLLVRLSGIGPVFASRIIRYRDRMGGFADVMQLKEVYGIKPDLVDQLAPQLTADKLLIRKISTNTATFKELVSHPYIDEQQTKGILNYRKIQGVVNNLEELVRNHILTREEADKVAPYLSFEK